MLKRVLSLIVAFAMSFWLLPSLAYAGDGEAIRRGLQERLRLSHLEVSKPALEGYVVRRGAVLVLQTDGASAKRLRVIQANTKSPRGADPTGPPFHVRDYAQVTVALDGTITAAPGDFTLSKGTRLVVLDLKVEKDRVRVFTHTLAVVSLPGGKTAYGCTEFVFPLDATARDRGDVATVTAQIDRVLALTING